MSLMLNTHSWLAIGYLLSIGICMMVVTQSAIFGLAKPRETIYVYFSMLTLSAAIYLAATYAYYFSDSAELAISALKIQVSALCVSLPLFIKFTEHYTGVHSKRLAMFVAVLALILMVLNHLSPYSLRFTSFEAAAPIVLPWGEVLNQYAGTFNGLRMFSGLGLAVLIWCMSRGIKLCSQGELIKGLMLVFSFMLMIFGGIWGTLIDRQLISSFYISGFTFLLLIFLISIQLAREHKGLFFKLEKHNHELELAASTFETHNAILILDAKFTVVRVNGSFEQLLGHQQSELLGRSIEFLKSSQHQESYYKNLLQTLDKQNEWTGHLYVKSANNYDCPTLAKITVLRDASQQIKNVVCIFNNLTEIKQVEEYLHHIDTIDQLTGLLNRKSFIDHLDAYLSSASRDEFSALILINLDKFKSINETYGHDHGDLVLFKTAFRLKKIIGANDLIARIGADEFLILAKGLGSSEAEASFAVADLAEQARAAITEKYHIVADDCFCTASVGISMVGMNSTDTFELIKRAGIAMTSAEKLGGNCVRFFEDDLQRAIENETRTVNDLHLAIKDQQFVLYYQVLMNRHMQPVGAETLIRWNHPELGLLTPAKFIAFAEESLLINDIGDWVLGAACKQLALWSDNPLTSKLMLSVNISAKQLMNSDFINKVKAIVDEHQINSELLKFEITENVAINNIHLAVEKMLYLKHELGIKLSIDDFGVGYSSLSQLKNLPANEIKIDLSFVRNILQSRSDKAVVKTIIDLGKNLNFEIVAEGVETKTQFELLKHLGCDRFQGYFFSKPVPVDDFERLVLAHAHPDYSVANS